MDCELSDVARVLVSLWEPARVQRREESVRRYRVEDDGGVWTEGDQLGRWSDPACCALAIEADVAGSLPTFHGDAWMLHAACVVYEGDLLFFVGDSGVGKSTLCSESLRRGATYVSDDVLFFDEISVSGFARTLRLAEVYGSSDAHYLTSFDVNACRAVRADGTIVSVPLWANGHPTLERVMLAEHRSHVVMPQHAAANSVSRASELERIRALHVATFRNADPIPAVTQHLGCGSAWTVRWQDPNSAFDELWGRIRVGSATEG